MKTWLPSPPASCVLTGAGEAEEDPCEVASSNLFPLLGATPIRGRTFSADEDKPEGPRVAILSYGLWQRRFGAEESAIGRSIDLNGASYTIVGVMAANFSPLYDAPYDTVPEMWVSGIALSPTNTSNDYFGIGRLKPGISPRQAEARMEPVSVRIDQEYPGLKGWRAELMSLRMVFSGDTRSALVVLMGSGDLCPADCVRQYGQPLACAGRRPGERVCGAERSGGQAGAHGPPTPDGEPGDRLAGGVLGVLLASWACKGLAALAPQFLLKSAPGLAGGAADWRVLAFALLTILATTVLFGLAPALQSARPHLTETLKETRPQLLQSPRSRRFRSVLVVSEIALAMVLLVGAGLMVRTLAQLSRVNLGFNPAHVLTLRVPLSGDRYKQPQAQVEFWEHVVAAVEALPGVESASVSRGLPIGDWAGQFFTTSDQPNPPAGQVPDANYVVAGPGLFPHHPNSLAQRAQFQRARYADRRKSRDRE